MTVPQCGSWGAPEKCKCLSAIYSFVRKNLTQHIHCTSLKSNIKQDISFLIGTVRHISRHLQFYYL